MSMVNRMSLLLVLFIGCLACLPTGCTVVPDGQTHLQSEQSATDYGSQLAFLVVPEVALPAGCSLVKQFQTAPLIPADSNPCVLTDKESIQELSMHFSESFGTVSNAHIEAGFTAVYQDRKPANEIGVYALLFEQERQAKETVKEWQKEFQEDPDPTKRLVRKGRLVLFIWCDSDVPTAAFAGVCDYFRKAELRNTTKR